MSLRISIIPSGAAASSPEKNEVFLRISGMDLLGDIRALHGGDAAKDALMHAIEAALFEEGATLPAG